MYMCVYILNYKCLKISVPLLKLITGNEIQCLTAGVHTLNKTTGNNYAIS